MTPEQLLEFQEMKRELKELKDFKSSMEQYSKVPYRVQEALARRFKLSTFPSVVSSVKTASSEDQAVNEAGSGTYNVLASPDGWLELYDANNNFLGYIPKWN